GDEQARTEALVQQLMDSPSGWSPELIFVGDYGSLCRAGERKAVDLEELASELRARSVASEDTAVVVVSGRDPHLAEAATSAAKGGTCVVAVGAGDDTLMLTLGLVDGSVELAFNARSSHEVSAPLATGADAVTLTRSDVAAIHEVLAHYREGELVEPGDPPLASAAVEALPATSSASIHLQLLGEVGIQGVRSPLAPQQLAVVAFLHLHPGATTEVLQQAVWGGRPPSAQRFKNVISEIRSVLGHSAFPVAKAGRYALTDEVSSDLARFEALTMPACSAAPEDALRLVRGVPLTTTGASRRHFGWVDLENLGSYWELQILRVALQAVEQSMNKGAFDHAIAAARQGLVGCPLNEELTRCLISAHIGAGQHRIAANVARELVSALEELGVDELDPATEALIAPLQRAGAAG
ncbi:MAG: BTAD domain-containing putative transcriptional regulator, partial [Acidimicrobiales bacterium]